MVKRLKSTVSGLLLALRFTSGTNLFQFTQIIFKITPDFCNSACITGLFSQ